MALLLLQDATQKAANIAASVNGFSFNLLRVLQEADGGLKANKNVIASPLSISVVFSFLYDGATPGSETRAEIATVLGFESDSCYGVLMRSSLDGLTKDASNGNELALASKVGCTWKYAVKECFDSSVSAIAAKDKKLLLLRAWILRMFESFEHILSTADNAIC